MAESATILARPVEVGLVCDAGTSLAALHGLTELFAHAGACLARRNEATGAAVRVSHWRLDDAGANVRCTFDSRPGSPHAPAVLVIPGNERAAAAEAGEAAMTRWLRAQHAQGVTLAAVCGGVFVLARTGLLSGRQATTHWAFQQPFAAQFPDVLTETDRMVIDYGDVITAGGILAWADLGLRLVERLLGPTTMLETARYMLIDPPGREQRFYGDFVPRTAHGDRVILDVQQRLASQRERPVGVAELASDAHLEARTFLRRFVAATGMTPTSYQQRLRISRARELLEFSRTSVEAVGSAVGYVDPSSFRRVFRKVMGLTPSEYRRRFGRQRLAAAPPNHGSTRPDAPA